MKKLFVNILPASQWVAFAFALSWIASFSGASLFKGQVIKQFTAYSITESLKDRPLAVLSTHLPCNPDYLWVEEPPLFHEIAALGLRIIPSVPGLVSLLSLVLIAIGVSILLRQGTYPKPSAMALAAVLLTPNLARLSIQHIPDILATAFLVLGAADLSQKRTRRAWIWFLLSTTTKVLTVFAILPLLAWDLWNSGKFKKPIPALTRLGLAGGALIAPFCLWLVLLNLTGTTNPFFMQNGIENRHSGSLLYFLNPLFYGRFFTWTSSRGVGWILFVAACLFLFRQWQTKQRWKGHNGFILAWCLGIFPYWCLVRGGNYNHDHYSLPFIVPWALAGLAGLTQLKVGRWIWLFLSLNIIHGMIDVASLKPIPVAVGLERPEFCAWEIQGNKP